MPKLVKKDEKTSNLVKQLSGYGLTQEQICSIVGISRPTLYKYYQDEMLKGKSEAHAQVAQNLFRIATGSGREAITASIFWLKTQAKWKETSVIEVDNVAEQDEQFRKLISDIRETKLSEKDSNESTH
jgi:transcriptional regulator with XRE-family HTH domain